MDGALIIKLACLYIDALTSWVVECIRMIPQSACSVGIWSSELLSACGSLSVGLAVVLRTLKGRLPVANKFKGVLGLPFPSSVVVCR